MSKNTDKEILKQINDFVPNSFFNYTKGNPVLVSGRLDFSVSENIGCRF